MCSGFFLFFLKQVDGDLLLVFEDKIALIELVLNLKSFRNCNKNEN